MYILYILLLAVAYNYPVYPDENVGEKVLLNQLRMKVLNNEKDFQDIVIGTKEWEVKEIDGKFYAMPYEKVNNIITKNNTKYFKQSLTLNNKEIVGLDGGKSGGELYVLDTDTGNISSLTKNNIIQIIKLDDDECIALFGTSLTGVGFGGLIHIKPENDNVKYRRITLLPSSPFCGCISRHPVSGQIRIYVITRIGLYSVDLGAHEQLKIHFHFQSIIPFIPNCIVPSPGAINDILYIGIKGGVVKLVIERDSKENLIMWKLLEKMNKT